MAPRRDGIGASCVVVLPAPAQPEIAAQIDHATTRAPEPTSCKLQVTEVGRHEPSLPPSRSPTRQLLYARPCSAGYSIHRFCTVIRLRLPASATQTRMPTHAGNRQPRPAGILTGTVNPTAIFLTATIMYHISPEIISV
ncbi:hypothetical protein PF005_g9309 [Phytophthora fragariae]|uniref:Uncharacterized protein n=1 Tax=Phytophthora fragariae TaxID=53985 RepID=A0A6A3EYF9_9STRA|nr:hypothetical protein PF003_g16264 [Phytophthora fragariae]KAE8938429.1 hypothetical protein PF009_g11701 [Phytophthora fragariae]KAE9015328.1 hypothetical protein PF011_g7682 [Phytophthora fragariae]KAE9113777.1 hypothetical protein PF010_g9964 [Phytophthora fragariae]KAE9116881.1 hypothetical protein PF007_g9512 [Phytophthora fragariae]